ncbi:MAG: hypothetical protein QME81_03780 [bacterium]|nr:hypothetical protein [bacterium]
MKRFLILLFILVMTGQARAGKIIWLADIDLSGSLTTINIQDKKGLGAAILLGAAPIIKVKDGGNIWLSPSYEFRFSGNSQPLQVEEEETVFFDRTLEHLLLFGLNRLNPGWKLKANGFYRKNLSNLSQEEDMGKGLYDYDDLGGWTEIRWLVRSVELEAGYKYTQREYPNYKMPLLSDHEVTFTGAGEKDSQFHKIWLGGSITAHPLFAQIKYTRQRQDYDHQILLTSLDTARQDNIHQLDLEAAWQRLCPVLSLKAGYSYLTEDSNQSELDLSEWRIRPDFFDYDQHTFHLGLSLPLLPRLKTGASYCFISRQYKERPARWIDGNRLEETEKSRIDDLEFYLQYLFSPRWKAFVLANYIHSWSNTKYSASQLNYDYFNLTAGVRFAY